MTTATDTHPTNLSPVVKQRLEKLEAELDELKGLVLSLLLREGIDPIQLNANRRRPDNTRPQSSSTAGDQRVLVDGGFKGARTRGETARLRWIEGGEIVPTQMLAEAWGLTPQALGAAVARSDAFAIKVANKRYFPREFLLLERDAVAAVCQALGDLSASEKFVFWTREHGVLGGKTVSSAVLSGVPLARLTQLARAWAEERGAAHGIANA